MKTVILAGGQGTRLQEETVTKPKPLVEVGGMPLLWHIMKIYSKYGIEDFIICLGYKGEMIKDYFVNYNRLSNNIRVDLGEDSIELLDPIETENWKVTLIDTGLNTKTAGRIKQIEKYIGNETFFMTYGDGVADIDLDKLLKHHKKEKRFATVTGVLQKAKYGNILCDNNMVTSFEEKPETGDGIISGGFFCLEPEIFNYIDKDTMWENEPIRDLVRDQQLTIYRHKKWWACCDTIRDLSNLNTLWQEGKAPWKIW